MGHKHKKEKSNKKSHRRSSSKEKDEKRKHRRSESQEKHSRNYREDKKITEKDSISDHEIIIDDSDETLMKRLNASISKARERKLEQVQMSDSHSSVIDLSESSDSANLFQTNTLSSLPITNQKNDSSIKNSKNFSNLDSKNESYGHTSDSISSQIPLPPPSNNLLSTINESGLQIPLPPLPSQFHENRSMTKTNESMDNNNNNSSIKKPIMKLKISETSAAFISSGVKIPQPELPESEEQKSLRKRKSRWELNAKDDEKEEKEKKKDEKETEENEKNIKIKKSRKSREREKSSERRSKERERSEESRSRERNRDWRKSRDMRSRERFSNDRSRRFYNQSHYYSHKDRYRSHDRQSHKARSRSKERSKKSESPPKDSEKLMIDKEKLRQIALKNAFKMGLASNSNSSTSSSTQPNPTTSTCSTSSLSKLTPPTQPIVGPKKEEQPKSADQVLKELTEFCKKLSEVDVENMDQLDQLIEGSAGVIDEEEMPFIPARTNKDIKSGPQKAMTLQEKLMEMATMSSLFPVSSGTDHKDPSLATSTQATSTTTQSIPDSIQVTSVSTQPCIVESTPSLDQTEVAKVSEVNSNIKDNDETEKPSFANKEFLKMGSWVAPGQFTGSTGVQVLSSTQLSGNYQTWATKDQINNAAPVSGGIGKLLLEKMGWKEGDGLGKNREGMVTPINVDVKTDRKGLVCPEEDPDRIKRNMLEKMMQQQAMLRQLMIMRQQQQMRVKMGGKVPLLGMPPLRMPQPTAKTPLLPSAPTPLLASPAESKTRLLPLQASTQLLCLPKPASEITGPPLSSSS